MKKRNPGSESQSSQNQRKNTVERRAKRKARLVVAVQKRVRGLVRILDNTKTQLTAVEAELEMLKGAKKEPENDAPTSGEAARLDTGLVYDQPGLPSVLLPSVKTEPASM